MPRTLWTAWLSAAILACGCATGPLRDNPMVVGPALPAAPFDNPIYVPVSSDGEAFTALWDRVIDVVDDYFEIARSNRYDMRIECFPRVAPGLGQPWKPGSPDAYERLYATFQTVRHRCFVSITPAKDSGYFIDVKVFKELEDLERPSRATAGAASFRSEPTLQRQFAVVEPDQFEPNWIPIGRDTALEQAMLERISRLDGCGLKARP
jgi:hypothetical protein